MSQSKGFQRERELVNLFYENEFAATRIPKSGGGTKRELPDVIVGNGEFIFAIEAKAKKDGYIYLSNQETYNLVKFSNRFGALPRIGVRFDYEDWYFLHPDDLYQTDSGNYRVSLEAASSNGQCIQEIVDKYTTDIRRTREFKPLFC